MILEPSAIFFGVIIPILLTLFLTMAAIPEER
jgi:hypothetical protein